MERLATGNGAGVDPEPVVGVADPAREALAEELAPEADVPRGGVLGLGERHRARRVDSDRCRTRLGDDDVPVQERRRGVLSPDRERPVERRRDPKRHLDLVGIDELREPAGRVTAVGRRERPAEAA